ncbi:hypothetical protein D9Q98_004854 [Chlorella vulgaris]|uniref:Uncharacterized protein n=1 Tax=Chlorella vulgaris TaxID=3077 RepID=A0A9D4YWM7_CHLVU|nr:hypothetical protein D9Q98_004854 [Chlorella vulgaris]
MVRLIDGHPIADAASLPNHPRLVQASARFLAQPDTVPEGPLIYACQGEIASIDGLGVAAQAATDATSIAVAAATPPVVLCASDATTCLIVAIVAAGSPGVARIIHHDEHTTRSRAALQQTVAGLGCRHTAKLWLVGAYAEADGVGSKVLLQLLGFLHACTARLEVQLCCAGSHNTAADGAPRCTALALHLPSLEARPAAPPPDQRGPWIPARAAQWAFRGAVSAESQLRQVLFALPERQLHVTLYGGRPPLPHAHQFAAVMLALEDEQLLQHCSTSPLHEPPHFVADQRASLRWLLQQAGPPEAVEHSFSWEGGWWRHNSATPVADAVASAARLAGTAVGTGAAP